MPTTHHVRRTPQLENTRAKPPFPNAVGSGQNLAPTAQNLGLYASNTQGDNSQPVDAYRQPNPSNTVQFAPGDPLRPIPGLGDRQGFPRAFPYRAGGNIQPQPRSTETVSFEQLRNLASLYEGIQMCESIHFRILSRLELSFIPRPEVLGPGDDPSDAKWVDGGRRLAEWFASPDKRQDLRAWMTAGYRDILEIDALGIYHRRNRGGSLYALELLAGDYLVCLADAGARTPLPPAPAYLQVLYGVPAQLLTTEEVDYLRETARTESLYGLSRVERIIMRVNLALRKGHFDLTRFTDGATPSGVMETQNPDLFRLTPDEVQLWQDMFNGMLAGNDAMRARAKAMPPGWTFRSLQTEQITTELDRWLLNITAADFGLSMDELGMTETSNRAVGDSQENMVYRNAVKPTADFFARYFTQLLQRYDGLPMDAANAMVSRAASATKAKAGTWDARYVAAWQGLEEQEDFNKKIESGAKLFQTGLRSKLQVVRWLKLPIEPGEKDISAFITTQGGMESVVVLEDIEAARQVQQQAAQVKLQTAQAGLKIQQDQGKQLDSSLAQQGEEETPEEESSQEEGSSDDEMEQLISQSEDEADQQITAAHKNKANRMDVADIVRAGTYTNDLHPRGPNGKWIGTGGKDISRIGGIKTEISLEHHRRLDAQKYDAKFGAGAHAAKLTALQTKAATQAGKLSAADRATLQQHVSTLKQDEKQLAIQAANFPRGSVAAKALKRDLAGRITAEYLVLQHLHRNEANHANRTAHESRSAAFSDDRAHAGREWGIQRGNLDAMGNVLLHHRPASTGNAHSPGSGSGILNSIRDDGATDRGDAPRGSLDTSSSRPGDPSQQFTNGNTISDEWRRFHDVALRAIKRGKAVPPFTSDILPQAEASWVATQLQRAATPDDVRTAFQAAKQHESGHLFVEARCMVCGCGEPTNDHGKPYPVLESHPLAKWTGIMIGFFLPAAIAQQIAVLGGEDPQELHVTLAYLGDTKDTANVSSATLPASVYSAERQERLRQVVEAWAKRQSPIPLRLSGIGRFSGGEVEPVYASIDSQQIQSFRSALVEMLTTEGFPVATDFAFTPHVTLEYVEPKDPMPHLAIPDVAFTCTYLWCCLGDRRYAYELGNTSTPDVVAELRALKAEVVRAITYP